MAQAPKHTVVHDNLPPQIPDSAYQAKQWIAELSTQLDNQDIIFRDPPEEPTSCCGRGCNGCVWEGYFSAVAYWCEQARALLKQD